MKSGARHDNTPDACANRARLSMLYRAECFALAQDEFNLSCFKRLSNERNANI